MAKVVLLLRRGVQASALVLLPAQTTARGAISGAATTLGL